MLMNTHFVLSLKIKKETIWQVATGKCNRGFDRSIEPPKLLFSRLVYKPLLVSGSF